MDMLTNMMMFVRFCNAAANHLDLGLTTEQKIGLKNECKKMEKRYCEDCYAKLSSLIGKSGLNDSTTMFKDILMYLNPEHIFDKNNGEKHFEKGLHLCLVICKKKFSLHQYEEAIVFCQKVVKIAIEVNDKNAEIDAYLILSDSYASLQKYQDAICYGEKCIKISKETGNSVTESDAHLKLSCIYNSLEQYEKAIQNAEVSIKIAQESSQKTTDLESLKIIELKATYEIGCIYFTMKQYEKAVLNGKKCIEIANETNDKITEMDVYFLLENAYRLLRYYDDAILYGSKCIEIAKETSHTTTEMDTYLGMAHTYFALGQHDYVIFNSKKCIEISNKLSGDKIAEKRAYSLLGETHFSLDQYDEAVKNSTKCIKISSEIGDQKSLTRAYRVLVKSYFALEQYDSVINKGQKWLEITIESGDKQAEMVAYLIMGKTYFALGQYDDAINNGKKCIEISKEIGDKPNALEASFLLFKSYASLGQYHDVLEGTFIDSLKETDEILSEMIKLLMQTQEKLSMGDYDDAFSCSEKCIKIAEETGEKQNELKICLTITDAYKGKEQYEKAILYGKKCMDIAKEIKDKQSEMRVSLGLAYSYLYLKNEDALTYSNICIDLAKQLNDKDTVAQGYLIMLNTNKLLNRIDEVICNAKTALVVAEEIDDKTTICTACEVLGHTYYAIKKYDDALMYSQNCMEVARAMGDKQSETKSCLTLCKALYFLKEYDVALNKSMECIEAAKETGCKSDEIDANLVKAKILYSMKELDKAISCGKKALQMATENKDKLGEANANLVISSAYSAMEKFDETVLYSERCLLILREIGSEATEPKIAANFQLLISYWFTNKHDQCILCCKNVIKIARENNSKHEEMFAHLLLAQSSQRLHKLDDVYKHLNEGMKLAEELEDHFTKQRFQLNFALFYDAVGKYETASEIRKAWLTPQSINFSQEEKTLNLEFMDIFLKKRDIDIKCKNLSSMASHHLTKNNYKEAIACCKNIMKLPHQNTDQPAIKADCYSTIADIYLTAKQYDKASKYYKKGLNCAKQCKDKELQSLCISGIGLVCYLLKNIKDAKKYIAESIRYLETSLDSLRELEEFKISIFDKYVDRYKFLSGVFFNTGDFKSSLLLSELCRARALRDRLSIKYLKLQEMKGEERIPFIDKDFVISTNKYSILFYSVYFDEVFAYLIENGEIKYVSSKALENFSGDLNKLTRKVFDEMQVSEVSNCENRSMDKEDEMRTTEADELLFFRLTLPKPKEKSNGTLLEGFRGNSPETKESYSYNCSLEELFMKLFGLEKHLITRDDIVIISDGPLQRVPFAALRDPDTGRYLSETMRIRLAPSLSFLKLINECPDDYHCKTGKLIIGNPLVGNVMFDGKETEFRPLENAFCEAHVVGSALYATPLTGENATKAAVIEKLQQGVSVIHIAAHGSLTKGRIALAPSPEIRATKIPDEEDYMLTMADVQKAQVRAQLVVLSCCHSGRGKIRAEGVVGMCRAFLASGARAVVASLWAIDDEATLEFMTRFYQNISERKLSASASLQQAMKEMRNTVRYNEPKYWAPFFLMGDDVTIKF